MESWVYLFSQFTPEALLFESLAICLVIAGYTAVWIMRRKRGQAFASGDLNSSDLQNQLAQLIAVAGAKFSGVGAQTAIDSKSTGKSDPALVQRISILESEVTRKDQSIESLSKEKERLQVELEAARSAGGNAEASGAAGADLSELQEKIRILEGKLSEYSVIEDDLANLKRLQQENADLRARLEGREPEAIPEAAEETATPIGEAEVATKPQPVAAAPKSDAPAAEAQEPAPKANETNTDFEGLVDDVEQSLAGAAEAPENPVEKKAEEPAAPEQEEPQGPALEANDADLVKEFEKMLKS